MHIKPAAHRHGSHLRVEGGARAAGRRRQRERVAVGQAGLQVAGQVAPIDASSKQASVEAISATSSLNVSKSTLRWLSTWARARWLALDR